MPTRRAAAPKRAQAPATTTELFNGHLQDLEKALQTVSSPYRTHWLNSKFAGNFKTVEEAAAKMEIGDPELLKKYKEAEKTANLKQPEGTRINYLPAEEGLYFSVPAYLEGLPEQWITEEEEPTPGKISDMYINIAVAGVVNESVIFKKLIQIVRLIDQAESTGHRLNIFACLQMEPADERQRRDYVTMQIQIKRDSEPVNLQQLVFLIANPVLIRFAYHYLNTQHAGDQAGMYMQCNKLEKEFLSREDIIYIPSLYYDQTKRITDYSDLKRIYPHLEKLID